MKIILFRHGKKQNFKSVGSKENLVSLSDKGIKQITKLAKILRIRFPELVGSKHLFSSPYSRTIQSGEIVRSTLEIEELYICDEFKEFSPVLSFSNSKKDKDLAIIATKDHNWIPPETGISFNQAIYTFQDKLKDIYRKNKSETILVSTHSKIVRNMVYDLEPKFRPSNDLIGGNSSIHEAGYSIINYDGEEFKVEKFNIHDYLDQEL